MYITYKKAFWVGIAIPAIQQLTGINVVMFYAPVIFKTQGSAYTILTFFCMFIHVLATFASIFITDRLGRRFLLIAGSIGCAVGLIFATSFYREQNEKPGIDTGTYLFDIAIYFFVSSFGLSHGPVE